MNAVTPQPYGLVITARMSEIEGENERETKTGSVSQSKVVTVPRPSKITTSSGVALQGTTGGEI